VRVVLRILALWFGLTSLLLALLLVHFGTMEVNSVRGAVAFSLLTAFTALAGFAAVQLWRLRESGRKAAIGVCLVGLAFVFVQFNRLTTFDVVRLSITGLVMLVLFSSSAKRACLTPASIRTEPQS
jgi:ABC-type antimicrobial peptide transport system permease subunit